MSPGLITQSFSTNLKLMKMCHLYPPIKPDKFFKIRAHIMHAVFVMPVPILGILHLLLDENLDMNKVNYNAGFLAQGTCVIAKLLPFITNGQRIRECIDFFENFSEVATQGNHQIITKECIKVCRRNTLIFLVCVVGATASWATKPLFWNGRNFPVDIWLPFDPFDNGFVYCCVYIFMITGIFYTSLALAAMDPLIAGLAYHATSQIKILKDNLENLSKYVTDEQGSKLYMEEQNIIYKKIKQCGIHHVEILRFVKEFQNCFSPVVFSQFCGSVFVICFSCLQLSKLESLGYNFFQLLTYFSVILAQIYFYCFYGSELYEESNTITRAIYKSNWYSYDIRCKKALMILMERCQKPNVVTSGKILDLNLETFAMILRRSYSLVAVLKNYQ